MIFGNGSIRGSENYRKTLKNWLEIHLRQPSWNFRIVFKNFFMLTSQFYENNVDRFFSEIWILMQYLTRSGL